MLVCVVAWFRDRIQLLSYSSLSWFHGFPFYSHSLLFGLSLASHSACSFLCSLLGFPFLFICFVLCYFWCWTFCSLLTLNTKSSDLFCHFWNKWNKRDMPKWGKNIFLQQLHTVFFISCFNSITLLQYWCTNISLKVHSPQHCFYVK